MGELAAVEAILTKISKTLDDIKIILDDTYEVSLHVHDAHWHAIMHESAVLSGEAGGMFVPPPVDEISFLLSELNNKLDKDENGMVFGLDFLIDADDPMCPTPLRNIERILKSNGQTVPSTKLSWFGYVGTLPWS